VRFVECALWASASVAAALALAACAAPASGRHGLHEVHRTSSVACPANGATTPVTQLAVRLRPAIKAKARALGAAGIDAAYDLSSPELFQIEPGEGEPRVRLVFGPRVAPDELDPHLLAAVVGVCSLEVIRVYWIPPY
jgi:hypothetical protein